MRTIRLKEKNVLEDSIVDSLLGKFVDESFYDILIQKEDVRVEEPDGSPLIVFRSRVLPKNLCDAAYPALKEAAKTSNNRGYAAGDVPEEVEKRVGERVKKGAILTGTRARPLKLDGTVSNTNYAQEVNSGIIGYYDRNARFPYCRLTAFTEHEVSKWTQVVPYLREIDAVFARELPDRHAAQMEMVGKTTKDFVIKGTSFTTITVNRRWRTACHRDKGDLKAGFGVMSAFKAGRWDGCYLCFPKFRVAVDMGTQDLLLANVHHVHGNTPFHVKSPLWNRISIVCYYRENMRHCGTVEEEAERANERMVKRLRGESGGPIYGEG